MPFAGISYLAVVIAAAVGFGIGAAWYMALAKPWMAAARRTEADIKSNPSRAPFVIAAASLLVMAYLLAGLMGHLGRHSFADGLLTGFFVWLAFVATTLTVNHRFQGAPWSLTLIDGGHWLAVLLAMGAIIGLIGP